MRMFRIYSVVLLMLGFSLLPTSSAEETNSCGKWREISKSVWVFSRGLDNVYLLKSEDKGLLMGAGEPGAVEGIESTGIKRVEYIFLWNARREQVRGLQELVSSLSAKFGYTPKVACPSTEVKAEIQPENALLERSREFWEFKGWRFIAGHVTANPSDIPLFTLKPDLYFRRSADSPFMSVSWGGYVIKAVNTYTPHRRAHSFLFEADGRNYAVTGRLVLPDGFVRHVVDVWSDEYPDLPKAYSDAVESLRLLLEHFTVDVILPELGGPMSPKEALASHQLVLEKLKQLKSLFPIPVRMNDAVYPGIRKIEIEGVSHYIINGGGGHYLLVNAGFPDALERIPEELGDAGKLDAIFVTDVRDIHAVSSMTLSERMGCPVIGVPGTAAILRDPISVNFPKNIPRAAAYVKEFDESLIAEWRGAKLRFVDFNMLGAGKQAMLMETTGSRVLFIGDALVNHRRFPYPSPWYSPDLRPSALKSVVDKINGFKPTHVADDWGIVEWSEEYKPQEAVEWAARLRKGLDQLVWPQMGIMGQDPFWARFLPDCSAVEWGATVETAVRLRNFTEKNLDLELCLTGEYLKDGGNWSEKLSLSAQQEAIIPLKFSIAENCPRTGTAVGLKVKWNGLDAIPCQMVLLQKGKAK
ncbi:MAG: hypothetical protein Kow00107_01250 [Planctomycetota bacterium]